MTGILLIILTMNIPGDLRTRGSFSFPAPRGIEENYWTGTGTYFYQRLRLSAQGFEGVILTEKDPGEEWGDLITGGLSYSSSHWFAAAAGALRVHFAHGLVLSHTNSWGSSDPLSLSKGVSWRMLMDNAESPGAADSGPLYGVAAASSLGSLTLTGVLARSLADPGETGLHRSPSELLSKGSITRDLAFFRVGYGPGGLSFAWEREREDSLLCSGSRIGADFIAEGENSILTGEFATDLDSIADFVVSATKGLPEFRHGITVSRSTGEIQDTSVGFGSSHRFGAGYGIRWRPLACLLADGGVLYIQGIQEDRMKAGIQFSWNLKNNTELSQRFKLSVGEEDHTITGRAALGWSPHRNLTVSIKVPFSFYSSYSEPCETGMGLEARLKHRLSDGFEYSFSAAGCGTDGWNSRVYAYSLSFPGEFGSAVLYNNTALLQASISLHIEERAVLRVKGSWYCMKDAETLGSGWEETQGSSTASAGAQLDWSFQ